MHGWKKKRLVKRNHLSSTDDDVVDWNKDELHKESHESHYYEPDCCTDCNFREFYKQQKQKKGKHRIKHRSLLIHRSSHTQTIHIDPADQTIKRHRSKDKNFELK